MKGKIIQIREVLNDDFTINCYEIVIDSQEMPKLKLGRCEIIQ